MKKKTYPLDKASYSSGKCDVRIAGHHIAGDLREYDIHVEPIKGVGPTCIFRTLRHRIVRGLLILNSEMRVNITRGCVSPRNAK